MLGSRLQFVSKGDILNALADMRQASNAKASPRTLSRVSGPNSLISLPPDVCCDVLTLPPTPAWTRPQASVAPVLFLRCSSHVLHVNRGSRSLERSVCIALSYHPRLTYWLCLQISTLTAGSIDAASAWVRSGIRSRTPRGTSARIRTVTLCCFAPFLLSHPLHSHPFRNYAAHLVLGSLVRRIELVVYMSMTKQRCERDLACP
jgi:hypothetical protein